MPATGGPQLGAAAAAAVTAIHRKDPPLGPHSQCWAPLVLSRCTPDMPAHWAPCLVGGNKDSALVYGEELIYPDASIPIPGFLSEANKSFWLEHAAVAAPNRFVLIGERAVYLSQHGQNLVFRNVSFKYVSSVVGDQRAILWLGC